MKKTLVAAAILAASGASFAQATITGNYIFGYTVDTNSSSMTTGGLHTDTANVQFGASEDLGGGLKASAQVSIASAARGKTVGGEDAFLAIEGGFGKVKMGAMESGQAYDVNDGVGAPIYGFDGTVFATNVTNDSVTYTLPKFGDVAVSVGYADYSAVANNTANGQTGALAGTASGTGQAGDGGNDAGTAGAQRSTNVAVAYAAGPVAARAKYIAYGNQDASATSAVSRYLVDASYDLGVAKFGVGFARSSYNGSKDAASQMQLDVAAPIGALTVGAAWAKSFGGTIDSRTGYQLGVSYALSKRTSVNGAAYNWTQDNVSGNNTGYRVLVGHSF